MLVHVHVDHAEAMKAGKVSAGYFGVTLTESDIAQLSIDEREELAKSENIGISDPPHHAIGKAVKIGMFVYQDIPIPDSSIWSIKKSLRYRIELRNKLEQEEKEDQLKVKVQHEKRCADSLDFAKKFLAASIGEQMSRTYFEDDAASIRDGKILIRDSDCSVDLLPDDIRDEYTAALDETIALVAKRTEERARKYTERKIALENAEREAKEKYNAERAAWIADHGSKRLKMLAAEGIRHNATYIEERMAIERPGWERYVDICGVHKEIRDATEEQLDALTQARVTDPLAYLCWIADGGHLEGCVHNTKCEEFIPGPALASNFLKDMIIKRI